MRITQGTFSYLPDLTDEQIEAQLRYALSHGWSIMFEYTDDPHPRNSLWEMWAPPRFDLTEDEVGTVMEDLAQARKDVPGRYLKIVCYDRSLGRQSSRLSFIVARPANEPGFRLERQTGPDRQVRFTVRAYSLDKPEGERYAEETARA